MAQKDYADILCQAVDEIVTKKLEGISFDKTINCTIIDDKKAKDGQYKVTDGSAKFYAYSASTDYKENDAVYVHWGWSPKAKSDISSLKVNNLNDCDLKYILAYLAFPQKFWKISKDYYKNINKCNKNSFIALFTKGLDRSADQLEYITNMIEIFQTYYNIKFY